MPRSDRHQHARPQRVNLSNWRRVRVWERSLTEHLRDAHSVRWHSFWIGLLTMAAMLAVAALQKYFNPEGYLSLRYALTLGAGYLTYLLLLRVWAAWMVGNRHTDSSGDPGLDVMPTGQSSSPSGACEPGMTSGQGSDFAGGGASGDWGDAGSAVGETLGEVAGGAVEVVAGADEAAVVLVPVALVFGIIALVVMGAGSLLMLVFGVEVLLAVAVELAFVGVSMHAFSAVTREGWLSAAVRLTWKPLLGTVILVVALGLAIDWWLPHAQSLPHAVNLMRAS